MVLFDPIKRRTPPKLLPAYLIFVLFHVASGLKVSTKNKSLTQNKSKNATSAYNIDAPSPPHTSLLNVGHAAGPCMSHSLMAETEMPYSPHVE